MAKKRRKSKMYKRAKNHCGRPHKKYARRRNSKSVTDRNIESFKRRLKAIAKDRSPLARLERLSLGRAIAEHTALANSGKVHPFDTHPADTRGSRRRNPRFMSDAQLAEMMNLWHLSNVPTAGTKGDRHHERMIITSKWMHQKYPSISTTAAYKDLEVQLAGYRSRNPHPSGLSYGEQIQRAWKQQKKKGDTLGMLYYETRGPGSSALASWESFKGSWAGQEWIRKQKQSNPGEDGILYETKNMYAVKSKGGVEIRLNVGTHSVVVGTQPNLAKARTTMDRLEKYPSQLHAFHKFNNPKTNSGTRAMTVTQALRLSPRKLGSKLQEWHGGGGSGLYAVGSTLSATGKLPEDDKYMAAAVRELLNLKKDANYPETVTAGDIQETKALVTAIRMLQRKG